MLISIITAMRNEAKFVGKCPDSLLSQIEVRDKMEILCVDDRSTGGTPEIVAKMAALAEREFDRAKLADRLESVLLEAVKRA